MDDATRTSRTAIPAPDETERLVQEVQRSFQRTLGAWASDVLALRQAGLDRPVWSATTTTPWSNAA